MNICVEDNFKEDLLGWALREAGHLGQEEREEVTLHHGCLADILFFLDCYTLIFKENN